MEIQMTPVIKDSFIQYSGADCSARTVDTDR